MVAELQRAKCDDEDEVEEEGSYPLRGGHEAVREAGSVFA